VTASALLRLSY